MRGTLNLTPRRQMPDAAVIAARNARNLDAVRWYLIIYPFGRKHLPVGLDREIARRMKSGETPIEYFAPLYVEAKEVNGRIVSTDKPLFENYVFVHASIREIFVMKKYEERYNLPRREVRSNGEQYYPYISDETVQHLKWIARSYSGTIPVYTGDTSWLIRGDRVRLISGPLKGVEATLFDNPKSKRKELMLVIGNWMSVPLLHVKENQYVVIGLNGKAEKKDIKINDEAIPLLHEILCRKIEGDITEEDRIQVRDLIAQYEGGDVHSDVMRCKLYAILLMAYTLLEEADKRDHLMGNIHVILPAIKAEQSKALLLTALYGCTDSSLYHRHAHQIVDPWKQEDSPKKSKQQLIDRLADYDRCFKH